MSSQSSQPQRSPSPEDRVRGVAHLILSRPELVEQQCRAALASEPDNAYALGMLSLSLNNQSRPQEALEAAEAAIHASPQDYVGHNYRAMFLSNLGRATEANEAIQEAIRLNPESAGNFEVLSVIAQREGDWNKLVQTTGEALRLDPDNERCAYQRVIALRKLGRGPEAVAASQQALERHPNSAAVHIELAETLLVLRRGDEALEHFRQALQLDPNSERARSGVVTALKARYWVYRASYEFFQIPSEVRKFSGLGLLFVLRLANQLAHDDLSRAAGAAAFLALMVLIITIIWLAEPVFNLLLRLNPTGRWALNDRERRESNIVGACLAAGLLTLAGWPILQWPAAVLGIGAIMMAAPLTAYWRDAHSADEKQTAAVLSGLLIATLLVGSISFALEPSATPNFRTWPPATLISAVLFGFLAVSSVLSTDPSTFRR